MPQVKPYIIQEQIFAELLFPKIFPINELLERKILERTPYGLTLTQHFKSLMLEKMREQNIDNGLISKFEERKYTDIKLEDLWTSIVSAVCHIHNYNCKIKNGKPYVDEENINDVQTKASAVYVWFKHVQTILQKEKLDIQGDYV
ncbi:MAG: hypothetical protein QXN63_02320 [Candidatus Bathyarchaeia archaeon]